MNSIAQLLVITADDLGIDPRRDEGILAAYAAGAITQASLMVGGPSATEAARRARAMGLPLGLHLDLSEMPPLAAKETIPTLLNAAGEKLGKHGFRLAVAQGAVDAAHVVLEAEAQFDAFARLTGQPARHLDGHQHSHWAPGIAEALAPVLRRRGVRSVRAPQGKWTTGMNARDVYAHAGARSTHRFVGLDPGEESSDPVGLRNAVMADAGGMSVELMCHVGFSGSGGDDFNRSADRERELRLLCSRPFAPLVDGGLLELVSFDDLFERGGLC